MSTASKAARMKMPDWQFGDEVRRLFVIENQQDINLLLSRLARHNYSSAYRGRVIVRALEAAKRLNLRLPAWATPKVLAEAGSMSAFGAMPDIVEPETVTMSGAEQPSAEEAEKLQRQVEAQAESYAAARNKGRTVAVRKLNVPGYDDIEYERLDEFIGRRNQQLNN